MESPLQPPSPHAPPLAQRHGRACIVTTPPLNRTPMAPQRWTRTLLQRLLGAGDARGRPDAESEAADGPWHHTASLRRALLVGLVLLQTVAATDFMASVLPYQGRQPLEIAILVLFAILFAWISAGFWTAIAGFFVLMRGGDRYAISRTAAPDAAIGADARTAIVMPIFNENVAKVFANIRATWESLERAGRLHHFDFFVLSDSSDPDTCVAEMHAWLELNRAIGGFGRIYYRRRRHRIKRKSGNIADFCRRWGRNYRYMVVLDADSVMAASCLTRLVQLMEANPGAGIIQTAPVAAGRETLYARVQQFANRAYGPLYTAGLHFWQLGESHYWGHNAIIRVQPFMRHCALSRLPGRGALSGEILSHDFVEAALMRRAGWAVWLAYDLPGSYEEMPPNLVDELARDRRWCHGNLMNIRLFMMKGLHPAHRAVFMTGVMAYLSAPLWFASLVLATALLAVHTLSPPQYFTQPFQLFPLWPEWRPERAIMLFGSTALLLFLPKVLSIVLILRAGAPAYGGGARVAISTAMELVFSALLAPIRMLFHTQFITGALTGWGVQWKSPPREDAETGWGEALRRHGWQTLLGIVWAAGVYWLNPAFLWWLAPIVGALILSIPLSVLSSRVTLGRREREGGFFMIPEELQPPSEIRQARDFARLAPPAPSFAEAVGHALAGDPQALPPRDKLIVLNDPAVLEHLQEQIARQPGAPWPASAAGESPRETAAHV
jgi:membrane glycosyltransferase